MKLAHKGGSGRGITARHAVYGECCTLFSLGLRSITVIAVSQGRKRLITRMAEDEGVKNQFEALLLKYLR